MRLRAVAIVTLCGFAACGRDPILEKAEADAAAARGATARGEADDPPAGGSGGVPGAAQPGDASGGVPGAAQPGDASGGAPTPMGPDGQPLPGAPGEPAPGIPEEPTPGIPGSPTAPTPGAAQTATVGSPRPGIPTEPAPGIPTQPPPGSGAGGLTGPTVNLSGTVVYPGWKAGKVKLTAFDADHAAGAGGHPKVIGFGELDRPGAFTVAVSEGAGKVYLQASIDEDGNGGPGPLEPQGKASRYPVTVGTSAIAGLEIVLTKREPPPGGRGEDF